jgi:hypothetical protein
MARWLTGQATKVVEMTRRDGYAVLVSPGWVGGRWCGSMMVVSVIVGAPNIERVPALETEYDPALIVDAHHMAASEIAGQRMQAGRSRSAEADEIAP